MSESSNVHDSDAQHVDMTKNAIAAAEVELDSPATGDVPPALPVRDENYYVEVPQRLTEELEEIDFDKTELPPVPPKLPEHPPALPEHPPALPPKHKHDSELLNRSNFDDDVSALNSEEGVSLYQDEPGEITDVHQFLMIRNGLALSDLVRDFFDQSIIRDLDLYKQKICDFSNDALSLERNYCNGKITVDDLKTKYISDKERKHLLFTIATKSEYFDTSKITIVQASDELNKLLEELSIDANDSLLKLHSYTGTVPSPLIVKLSDYLTRSFEDRDSSNMLIALNELTQKTLLESNEVSNSFYFLLLRTLENINPKELISLASDSQTNAVEYFKEKLLSLQFWVSFFDKLTQSGLLEQFLDMVVIFDLTAIINTLISYLYDSENFSVTISPTLIQFANEYQILTSNKNMELFEDDVELNKHKNRRTKLTKDLDHKKKKFADLERSIKESSSTNKLNALTLNELITKNKELNNDIDLKHKRIEELVSNFEVIRINNNKNNEIKLINDELREEINSLSSKISELRAKIKQY